MKGILETPRKYQIHKNYQKIFDDITHLTSSGEIDLYPMGNKSIGKIRKSSYMREQYRRIKPQYMKEKRRAEG